MYIYSDKTGAYPNPYMLTTITMFAPCPAVYRRAPGGVGERRGWQVYAVGRVDLLAVGQRPRTIPAESV